MAVAVTEFCLNFILSLLCQTDPFAGGDNERKGEQDHYFCGDQTALR